MDDIDQARRHLVLASNSLARHDFNAARFHIEAATRWGRLEERTRKRAYNVEVLHRTDHDRVARHLVQVRTMSAMQAPTTRRTARWRNSVPGFWWMSPLSLTIGFSPTIAGRPSKLTTSVTPRLSSL